MTDQVQHATLMERIYALLAYTSAITVLALGGYAVSLGIQGAILSAPWQIVLVAMMVLILAATVASCGNHHEKPQVRAATWGIVAPLGIVNPIAWLGALVIIARLHTCTTQHHAIGD